MHVVVVHRVAGLSPAAVAEELREPLAALRNAAYLLTVSRDGATIEKACQIVARQVERLSGVVDDLVEILRAAGGGPGQGSEAAAGPARAATPAA